MKEPANLFVDRFLLHHLHSPLNREGRRGTADDFTTSLLHFSLFSTDLWVESRTSKDHL